MWKKSLDGWPIREITEEQAMGGVPCLLECGRPRGLFWYRRKVNDRHDPDACLYIAADTTGCLCVEIFKSKTQCLRYLRGLIACDWRGWNIWRGWSTGRL